MYRHHRQVRRVLFLHTDGRYLMRGAIEGDRIALQWTKTATEAFTAMPGASAAAVDQLCAIAGEPVLVRALPYAPAACSCFDCLYYTPGYRYRRNPETLAR